MPMYCCVYGCSSRSSRETDKRYFRVPKIAERRGEKWKTLTEKRRKKWILNLRLQSGGAESANARVCSDHFVRGCPSALGDEESEDWAPTVKLGYERKPKSESAVKREKRMKLKAEQYERLQCAEAILDLQQTAENPDLSLDLTQTVESPEPQLPAENQQPEGFSGNETFTYPGCADAGCQTELTMDDIEKMEDVLRQNTTELINLRIKALVTQFSQESFVSIALFTP